MAVHLHLLVLVFILLVPTTQQARGNVSHFSPMDDLSPQINFKVVTGNYKTFLGKLHRVLANTPTHMTVGPWRHQVPVLAQQRKDSVPARWIHVNLVGTDAVKDKTKIAIRDDNIYIVGFTNSTGSWFEFKSRAHVPLIPSSIVLPFGDRYSHLLLGGYKELKDIKLGKENMLEAVNMLALHHPNHPNLDNSYNDRLKVALARLCVMVAEAERFVPTKERVAQEWKGTPQITDVQADSVVLWGDISRALFVWQKTKHWTYKTGVLRDKAKIYDADDALRTLGLVLWPNDWTFSFDAITADDDGKPLADDSSTTCNGTCN